MEDGKMHVCGTKFGPLNIKNGKAEFLFPLIFNENGTYELSQKEPDNYEEAFTRLWTRLKGN
jgi:inner membrane protein